MMRYQTLLRMLLAVMLFFFGLAQGAARAELTPVTMQLKWKHQFQFAGFYAALEQGFYREAGLDVTLRDYSPEQHYLDAVLEGGAHFGVAGPELLLQRMHGKPFVALAVIMQHSPNVIMSLRSSEIFSPHGLVGKRIMLAPEGQPDIWAMLRNEGVSDAQYILAPLTWDLEELIDGRIDATGAYVTNTPFLLKQRNIPYTLLRPRTYGVDFYGDCIFTTQAMLDEHPETVRAFREASLRGWQYAMRNTQAVIDLILERYDTNKTRAHLTYEAQTLQGLMLPELVQIGHMNKGRWEYMAETFVELGLTNPNYSLDGFLYAPEGNGRVSSRLMWWSGGVALAALFLAGWLLFFNARLKTAVSRRTSELSQLNEALSKENNVRRQVEAALRESEETIRAMSNASLDAIIMIDAYGKISFWNKGATEMFGYTAREAMGHPVHELIALPEDRQRAQQHMPHFTLTGDGPIIGKTLDFVAKRKDGSTFPVELVVASFQHGGQWCAVGSVRDATSRKQAEAQLRYLAITDSLTGANNRRHFMEQAEQEIIRSRRYSREMALIMLDIDHFKRINDFHGHEAGDNILKAFANAVRLELRTVDVFARLGGEEFIILLPETALDGARRVAERIRQRVADLRYGHGGNQIAITVSAGVARLTTGMENVEDIIRQADAALYRAKEKGRNRVEAWLTTTDRLDAEFKTFQE